MRLKILRNLIFNQHGDTDSHRRALARCAAASQNGCVSCRVGILYRQLTQPVRQVEECWIFCYGQHATKSL